MRAASSPVVALWLWCRSGRFTVPPGLYTCQQARQPVQPGHAEERGKKKKFSSYSISPALSHAPESSFSVLPLIVYPSPQYSPFLALLSFSLNFHILKSFFFLIRRTFCPPRTSVQHTCRTLFAATQFAAQGRW